MQKLSLVVVLVASLVAITSASAQTPLPQPPPPPMGTIVGRVLLPGGDVAKNTVTYVRIRAYVKTSWNEWGMFVESNCYEQPGRPINACVDENGLFVIKNALAGAAMIEAHSWYENRTIVGRGFAVINAGQTVSAGDVKLRQKPVNLTFPVRTLGPDNVFRYSMHLRNLQNGDLVKVHVHAVYYGYTDGLGFGFFGTEDLGEWVIGKDIVPIDKAYLVPVWVMAGFRPCVNIIMTHPDLGPIEDIWVCSGEAKER